jgi:hypothetical protein
MGGLKRASEIVACFVLFPLGCLFLVSVVVAVGVQALLIYVGALLAAWGFVAIGLPLLTGSMAPGEFVDGFRSRRRSEKFYEGEPLPERPLEYTFSKSFDADALAA